MARIRSIKPEFWTSAQILECSRNARLLFVGLWNFCDDQGRHPYSFKQAKAEVFPADDLSEDDIRGMLAELLKNDLIRLYGFENKEYFYVTGWKHQRIDKPQKAKYPDPFNEHSTTILRTFPPDTIGEDTIGKDRKGEDSLEARAKARQKKGTRLSEEWTPDKEGYQFATDALGSHSAAQTEFEKFRDYWKAKPGQSACKLDWPATWRNWIRNSKGKTNGSHRQRLDDEIGQLADEARRLERAAGISR